MLWSKFVNFLMSVLKWRANSYSNFTSFFIVKLHISPIIFKLMRFLIWRKESHQSPSFEAFKFLGKNLPNSSSHFWKHKSVLLQTLHHSSVLSYISPLYLFSWNVIYFDQKEPIKVQMFGYFECSGQNLSNSSCQFWNDKSIPI